MDIISELQSGFSGAPSGTARIYQRGTTTHTNTTEFFELEVFSSTVKQLLHRGRVGFVVPADTMHTFKADHNKILWSLKIAGDIEKGPDLADTYPIEVTPLPLT